MTTVVLWLAGAAGGGLIGWWLGREVNRGMPWGILVLGVGLVLAAVAAPFVWPGVFTPATVAVTRGLAADFVTMAVVTVETDLAQRGPAPNPDDGPDAGPRPGRGAGDP